MRTSDHHPVHPGTNPRDSVRLLRYQIHNIVFPGMVLHQETDDLAGRCLVDVQVFIFNGLDLLDKISTMARDMDRISRFERSLVDLDHGYAEMTVIMGHRADCFFMRSRLFHRRDVPGRRTGLYRE